MSDLHCKELDNTRCMAPSVLLLRAHNSGSDTTARAILGGHTRVFRRKVNKKYKIKEWGRGLKRVLRLDHLPVPSTESRQTQPGARVRVAARS